MQWIFLIGWLLAQSSASPEGLVGPIKPGPLLLVLPILGECPPEMSLPDETHLAESILLELPQEATASGDPAVRVQAEKPAGLSEGESWEAELRRRGAELGAVAVLWAELLPPADCAASRRVGLRILDLERDVLLERNICPSGAGAASLSRAMALATVLALAAGEIPGLPVRPREQIAEVPLAPVAPDVKPADKTAQACPVCPPPPVKSPAPRSTWFLAAGGHFSSHPNWRSSGMGVEGALAWSPWSWFELGLGLEGLRGRRVDIGQVVAHYSRWPIHFWAGLRWPFVEPLELLAQLGVELAWTRLDALLVDWEEVRSIDRFNPGLRARAGLRWWLTPRVGLELLLGVNAYLLRQRYVTGYYGRVDTVLSMQAVSLEASLRLVVPLD